MKRVPRPISVDPAEREYWRLLRRYQKAFETIAWEEIDKILPSATAKARTAVKQADLKLDDIGDDITHLFLRIAFRLRHTFPETVIKMWARDAVRSVGSLSKRGLEKQVVAAGGPDQIVVPDEPELSEYLGLRVAENVELIKSVAEKSIPDLKTMLIRELGNGTARTEIEALLRDEFDKSKTKARLIARDQIGKLNGQITQFRQKQIGVKQYVWRTAKDERVRDDHRKREGNVYSWSKPPKGGHPGQAIQCRCWAEPVLDEVVG